MTLQKDFFCKKLLFWYDKYARSLPWRSAPSLYKTVVSEFMLQQTQVDTVLPYFERWLNVFPGFEALSKSPIEDVLRSWEGLGYYSRARNLHALAKRVQESDVLPDYKYWLKMPGVGPYTAAAISSIAFNQPYAVVDGNVVRVYARLLGVEKPFSSNAIAVKYFQPIARDFLSPIRPGDWNQAIMELGAIVCKKKPLCGDCPLAVICSAKQLALAQSIPSISRKKTQKRSIVRFWCEKENQVLFIKNASTKNRLADFFELPTEVDFASIRKGSLLLKKQRGISQEHISESIYAPKGPFSVQSKNAYWISQENIPSILLSGPHRRWVKYILSQVNEKEKVLASSI